MKLSCLIIIIALLVGCRSAEDAFNDAQSAEMTGNNFRATQFYLETIRLQGDHPTAKARLQNVSEKQFKQDISRVHQNLQRKDGKAALVYIKKAENLKRIVAAYVPLSYPSNWSNIKADANQLVIQNLFAASYKSETQGNWNEALAVLSEINNYSPTTNDRKKALEATSRINDQAYKSWLTQAESSFKTKKYKEGFAALKEAEKYADSLNERNALTDTENKYQKNLIFGKADEIKKLIDQKKFVEAEKLSQSLDHYQENFDKTFQDASRLLKAKVYSSWANDFLSQNKFRQAWTKTQQSLEIDPQNPKVKQLANTALDAGKTEFLILPILHNKTSKVLSRIINESLKSESYSKFSPFVQVTPEFDLNDAVRALRVNTQRITREDAMRMAERVGARFAVFREITDYRVQSQFTKTQKVNIKRKDQTPTQLVVKSGIFSLISKLRITVIDAQTGHRIFGEEVSLNSKLEFNQAFPSEHPNQLILPEKYASIINPPGTQEDIATLEGESAKIATGFFNKEIIPQMEALVP
ncbi:MAG: hypothetical protein NE334_16700 [Lentisphaeraceae bacterium]|nr:hypothetical protein [Lentisphaeraceae bacterium]